MIRAACYVLGENISHNTQYAARTNYTLITNSLTTDHGLTDYCPAGFNAWII